MPPKMSRNAPRRRGRPVAAVTGPSIRSARAGGACVGAAASTGSCAVTWRNSSSRSLAARENVAIRRPRRDRRREEPRRALVVAVEPDLDRRVLEQVRRHDVGLGRRTRRARPRSPPRRRGCRAEHGTDPEPALDVGDAALSEDLAAVDDRDRGAQLLELGEDVAADEDRLAQRAQLAEELAQLDPRPRVEAGRRLVEEQHLRVVDEGVGQAQPLLHAAREALDVRLALVGRGRRGRAGRRSSAAGGRPAIP